MPVASLYDLARARLIQNIHMLDDIGDLPYAFLAPVLRQIQNPDQLIELETNCPQILGETGELWLRFVRRDIPNWDKKPHQPRDDKNWSKVYRKLKRDAEREEEAQAEALKQRMQAIQKDRKGHQTTIVEGQTGYQPSPRRKGFAFGGGGGWAKSLAPKETGKVAFDKLRRGIFDQKQARPKASQMPAHILAQRKRATVVQAPARMVRMQEQVQQEAPKRMLLSKKASESLAERSATVPATKTPTITSRPMPRPAEAAPDKIERTRLPAGQQFSAPRPQTQRPSVPGGKRRREEPSILRQPKRPKM
jgi:elongin-A